MAVCLDVLNQIEFRLIRRGRLAPATLAPKLRQSIASQNFALDDPGVLTPRARQLASILTPPIVVRSNNAYSAIANFRAVEICSTLPPDVWVGVLVLPDDFADPAALLHTSSLLTFILDGLSLRYVEKSILQLWRQCPPAALSSISPEFVSRSGLERVLGIQRKQKTNSTFNIQQSMWG